MKCPKCGYLGFETGDRCKNCGYDFSLTPAPAPSGDPELFIRPLEDGSPEPPRWDGVFDRTPSEPLSVAAATKTRVEQKLPLFSPAVDDSDEPLIKLPVAPRPPLAVRRTPDSVRLRAVPKVIAKAEPEPEPVLQFVDPAPSVPAPSAPVPSAAPVVNDTIAEVRARTVARLAHAASLEPSSATRRLGAVALDHIVLGAIDLSVIYLTARMADLPMSGWMELPLVPLVAFLMIVKLAYFSLFTAVGGQTIGKMATRIRVVTAENRPLAAAEAGVRSLAGTLSAVTLGLGYVPALFGSGRSAIHDRLTHTRVVSLPPV